MSTEISTWQQLAAIGTDTTTLDGDYILVNDLDKDSTGYSTYASATANGGLGWIAIGKSISKNFTGSFDGQGYVISDLNSISTNSICGLFRGVEGTSSKGAIIKNLSALEATIVGSSWYNAILATIMGDYSTIENCHVSGTIEGVAYNGGIAGLAFGWAGGIFGCSASVDITATGRETGGIVGELGNSVETSGKTVSGCWSEGSVSSTDSFAYIGGLVGYVVTSNYCKVENCYSTASVTAPGYKGGLIGWVSSDYLAIDKCYSTGVVSAGGSYRGGLIGRNFDSTKTTNCFWDKDTSGVTSSAGGTSKTTAEMQSIATFNDTDTTGLANEWDIATLEAHTSETWYIDDGEDYPRLWYEVKKTPIVGKAYPFPPSGRV
jgi:hypothetical protein